VLAIIQQQKPQIKAQHWRIWVYPFKSLDEVQNCQEREGWGTGQVKVNEPRLSRITALACLVMLLKRTPGAVFWHKRLVLTIDCMAGNWVGIFISIFMPIWKFIDEAIPCPWNSNQLIMQAAASQVKGTALLVATIACHNSRKLSWVYFTSDISKLTMSKAWQIMVMKVA